MPDVAGMPRKPVLIHCQENVTILDRTALLHGRKASRGSVQTVGLPPKCLRG